MITPIGDPYTGKSNRGNTSKRIKGECSFCGSILDYNFYSYKNSKACTRCCKSEIKDDSIYKYKKRLQKIFQTMVQRCTLKSNPSYDKYGGKGIRVVWKNSDEFIIDMGKSFVEEYNKLGEGNITIDRIDGKKDYCKCNCRRVDYITQNNNISCNKKYEILGGVYTVPQISRIVLINQSTIYSRIRRGLTIEEAINIEKK